MVFATLDLVRGFSAFAVVAWHAEPLFGTRPSSGYLAVDLFFVLSGVVIANAYDRRLSEGMRFRDFMAVRLIRLYPLYLLGMLIALAGILAAFLIGAPISWSPAALAGSTALSLLMLPTPAALSSNGSIFPLNTPSWSLFFEILINIAFFATFRWTKRSALLTIMLLSALWITAICYSRGSLNSGFMAYNWIDGLPRVSFSFCAGLYIARYRPIAFAMPAIVSVAAVVLLLLVDPGPFRAAFDALSVLLLFPLIVAASLRLQEDDFRFANFMGNISYTLYVLHVPILAILTKAADKVLKVHIESFRPWAGIFFLLVLVVLCVIVEKLYDLPVRRRLAHILPSGR